MDPMTVLMVGIGAAVLAYLNKQGITPAQVAASPTPTSTTIPPPAPTATTASGSSTPGSAVPGGGGAAPTPAPTHLPDLPLAPGPGGWQPSATCNSPDGNLIFRAWAVGTTLYMNGAPVDVTPSQGVLFPDVNVNNNGVAVLAFKQQVDGVCRIVSTGGVNQATLPTVGNYCVGVRVLADQSFQVYVYNAGPTLTIITLDANGHNPVAGSPMTTDPGTGQPLLGTSQGWLGIDSKGSPIWTDTNRSTTVGGMILYLPTTKGGLTEGQAATGQGIVVWDSSAQKFYYVVGGPLQPGGDIQLAARFAYRNDGAADVAVTNDPGGFYPRSAWTSLAPITVPPIDPGTHPTFLGVYPTGSVKGQNCRIVYATGVGLAASTLVAHPSGTPICVWVDTEYALNNGIDLGQAITSSPSPKIVYWRGRPTDDPPPDVFWSSLGPGDRVAYPLYRNQGEDIRTFEIAGRNNGSLIQSKGRAYVMVAGLWTRGFNSESQVLECGPPYRRLTDWPGCDGMMIFGLNRGTSIGQFLPSFQTLGDEYTSPGLPPTAGSAVSGSTPPPGPAPAPVAIQRNSGAPPVIPAVSSAPTRDQLARVYCPGMRGGVTAVTSQLGSVPSWGPEIGMLTNLADRQATYAAHRAAGATHFNFGIYGHYQENGVQYPQGIACWNDFTGNLPYVAQLAQEIINAGMYPLIGLGADELPFTSAMGTDHPNVSDLAPQVVSALGPLADHCVFYGGLDSVVPIGNTDDQHVQWMIDMILAIRNAIGNRVQAFELPSGWSFWGPGQYAGAGSYTSALGQAVDTWLQEFDTPPGPPDAAPTIVGGTWDAEHNDYAPVWSKDATAWNQIWQIAARTVPYLPPADQPFDIWVPVTGGPQGGQNSLVSSDGKHPGQYPAGVSTPRGRFYWGAFEIDTYGWTHGNTTADRCKAAWNYISSCGYDS